MDSEANAAAIGQKLELSPQARALLKPDLSPDAFVTLLNSRKLYADGLAFIAGWLPIREAIWWGCQCTWHVTRPSPSPLDQQALQCAVNWVLQPTEANRRQAERAAAQAGSHTPAGCLALAVYCTPGSLAPEGLPAVPAPAGLGARALEAALAAAAARGDFDHNQRQFIVMGLDVAHGKNSWTKPKGKP
jgi:hypothetical protein